VNRGVPRQPGENLDDDHGQSDIPVSEIKNWRARKRPSVKLLVIAELG
jgi:hypothetical protein